MYTFLLVLLIIDSLILVAAILLQSGTGGGISASFGGASSSPDALIGMRQAGNLLTTVSWWAGGIFLGLAFIMQLLSTHSRVPKSILEGKMGTPAGASLPAPSPSAPAVPLSAPSTPPKK
jgi:preprotein translocase subunit SecG